MAAEGNGENRMGSQGRFRRGVTLTRKSWVLLRSDRRLLVFPLVSMAVIALASLVLFGLALAGSRREHSSWPFFLAGVAGSYPLTAVAVYCNVAFVAMAADVLDGRETSVRRASAAANRRLGCILRWALVATVVGGLIRLLGRLPGGGLLVLLVQWLLGLAWAVATIFVVPVIAFERCGMRQVFDRSVEIIRKRWGETVTVGINAAAIFLLALVPVFMLGALGGALLAGGDTQAGAIVVSLAVIAFAVLIVLMATLNQAFVFVLYRFAVDGDVTPPFTEAELHDGLRAKRDHGYGRLRRWLHR
jgi:hypothetical protein